MNKNLKNRLLLHIIFLLLPLVSIEASTDKNTPLVDTVEIYSDSMDKNIKNTIIIPSHYDQDTNQRYPVVYLLHGHGGSHSTWIQRTKPSLQKEATRWGLIIVCPDAHNSWYWDSPVNTASRYQTYTSKELVAAIDKKYRTIPTPRGRAITGFSMGGHGGLWLGIHHPEVYGACGSMSGGVDIRPYPKKWNLEDNLGPYKGRTDVWNAHTVIMQLDKVEPGKQAIIIDCGTEDFFYAINEKIHQEMVYRQIQHDYIVRPGAHNHDYWSNAIDYQLLFFSKYFEAKQEE